MQYIFVISAICVLFFTTVFLFLKRILALFSYKDVVHHEDFQPNDILNMRIITGVLMFISWGLMFYALNAIELL